MTNSESEIIVVLLLINKGEPLNNSFKIIRILESMFGIIDVNQILDEIKEKRLADFELINSLHYYKLTSSGISFVKEKYYPALRLLLQHYPKNAVILTSLFESFLPHLEE